MAALGWLLNLDFALGDSASPVVVNADTVVTRYVYLRCLVAAILGVSLWPTT